MVQPLCKATIYSGLKVEDVAEVPVSLQGIQKKEKLEVAPR